MEAIRITLPPDLFSPAAFQHFEGQLELPCLKAGPDLYSFSGPLEWQADVSNTGDAFLITGTVRGNATTSCARCLSDFSFSLVGELEGYYLIDPKSDDSQDQEEEEFDILPEDHTIDFAPLIQAALLLEFPLVPLCDEDCKGLCSSCGANLNEESCECGPDTRVRIEDPEEGPKHRDNPFAVLKDFDFGQ